MKTLGITGNIGSGKTTVSKILESEGAYVINADLVAREVLEVTGAGYDEAVGFFGEAILTANGEIDRAKLAEIVFADPEKLAKLNAITHKHVLMRTCELIADVKAANAHNIICLDVPLLFEAGFDKICDTTWTIDAPAEMKITRAMERDKAERSAVKIRLDRQTDSHELREKSDIVIENDKGFDELREHVMFALSELLREQ